MRTLTKTTVKIFNQILQMAEANENHIKIDNTNGSFMPVCVEVINTDENYKYVSVAHYYEQNGDLMADPEIVFAVPLFAPDQVFPIEQKMDGLALHNNLVTFENGKPVRYIPALQYDVAVFCTQWFRNIKNQQKLN